MVKNNSKKLKSNNKLIENEEINKFSKLKENNIYKCCSSSINFIFYRYSLCQKGVLKFNRKINIYQKNSAHDKNCLIMRNKKKCIRKNQQ